MLLRIISVKAKPFQSAGNGETVDYFWTKAKMSDGTIIDFGTRNNYENAIDETIEIPVEKVEFSTGRKGYKEVSID